MKEETTAKIRDPWTGAIVTEKRGPGSTDEEKARHRLSFAARFLDGVANLLAGEHFELAERVASLAGGCFDLAGEVPALSEHGGGMVALLERLNQAEHKIAIQRGALQGSREARREAEAEIGSLKSRLSSANARIEQLNGQCEMLRAALERSRGTIDQIDEDRDRLRDENARLIDELNDLRNQAVEAIEEHDALVSERDGLITENDRLKARIVEQHEAADDGTCPRCKALPSEWRPPLVELKPAPIGGHDHGPDEPSGHCAACKAGVN